MSRDDIILDPLLRRSARLEREYWHKVLGDVKYKLVVSTTDPSHIYTWSGWPLKIELFKDERKE
jgi:hypothetical protein